jgi:hypothetical protein
VVIEALLIEPRLTAHLRFAQMMPTRVPKPFGGILAMTSGDKACIFKIRSRAIPFVMVALLALGGSAGWPLCATAQVSLNVIIGTPPPPVRYEVVPQPQPGYIWAPGYWSWNGHRHVWYKGHWEVERAGEHYIPAQWVETPRGWRFIPAHWEHPEHEHFCPPGQAKKGRC